MGDVVFSVKFVDYMRKEPDGFKIYRPCGSGDWLFLYFPCPMKFKNENNETCISEKNACVIYAPGDFQSFEGYPHFQNTFVHFECDNDDMNMFSFEPGKLFYTPGAGVLNNIVKKIKEEKLGTDILSENMLNTYMTQLLITAERCCNSTGDKLRDDFIKLRYDMLENFGQNYSSKELAAKMCMSKSTFYANYKKIFGRTPKQELLKARMEAAHMFLTNENVTVAEIAEKVGFENVEHFSRYYKKYYGVSPRNRTKNQ